MFYSALFFPPELPRRAKTKFYESVEIAWLSERGKECEEVWGARLGN